MLEFKDGTFGPIEPLDDALPKFLDLAHDGDVKAFHVGTERELKTRKTQQEQLADLEDRIRAIENAAPAQSSVLHIPTPMEIEKILEGGK